MCVEDIQREIHSYVWLPYLLKGSCVLPCLQFLSRTFLDSSVRNASLKEGPSVPLETAAVVDCLSVHLSHMFSATVNTQETRQDAYRIIAQTPLNILEQETSVHEIVRQRFWGVSATANERTLTNNAIQLLMNE